MSPKPLPYKIYTVPTLLLAVIGLLSSTYLSIHHYLNYTDMGYSSFCAISATINCDTVSQSPFSILAGIPLAIWGVFAYLLFIIIAIPAQNETTVHKYLWDLLFLLALLYSLADVYFSYLTVIKIKAYCLMCLITYAVSLSLLFYTWLIRKRFNKHSVIKGIQKSFSYFIRRKALCTSLIFLFISFGSLKLFQPTYWIFEYPPLNGKIHTGVTEDGHPWIGAQSPTLTIKEFTDYQCFQCSKFHLMLRYLLNEYPESIRLVHYHYPMDHKFNTVLVKEPFHTGSGDLALLAIAAAKQNKFWETNDSLYALARQGISEFSIHKFAKKLNLDPEQLKYDMYSTEAYKLLEEDIRTGLKNIIIGTPSFLIDGKVYHGNIPQEILNQVLQ